MQIGMRLAAVADFCGSDLTRLAREVVTTPGPSSYADEILGNIQQIGVRIGRVRPPQRRARLSTPGARQRRGIRFRHSGPPAG